MEAIGIVAAVPIIFKPNPRPRFIGHETKPLTTGFLSNYDLTEVESNEKTYTLKTDLLLDNYKDFLLEFYDLIDVFFYEKTGISRDAIPTASTLEEFMTAFSRDNRQKPPFVSKADFFVTCGLNCSVYWVFHSGSFLTKLEEDKTLLHFESALTKSMKNPLAQAIKIGVFGAY